MKAPAVTRVEPDRERLEVFVVGHLASRVLPGRSSWPEGGHPGRPCRAFLNRS
jgi:hypothetical protein